MWRRALRINSSPSAAGLLLKDACPVSFMAHLKLLPELCFASLCEINYLAGSHQEEQLYRRANNFLLRKRSIVVPQMQ